MKLVITLISIIALSGCSTTVPVIRTLPEAPEVLMAPCPSLQLLPEGTIKLSDVLSTVAQNYSQYAECQVIVKQWQEWYTNQKKIFESAN
jgi:hypothetical protein